MAIQHELALFILFYRILAIIFFYNDLVVKIILASVFAILVCSLTAQSVLRVRDGKDYALFISADDFRRGWSSLPTVGKEAGALQAELQHNYGFTLLPALHNPTTAEVVHTLETYARLDFFKPGDQLLIYISTHGYINEAKTAGGLAFTDSKLYSQDLAEQTLLPYAKLKSLLDNIHCGHQLLVLDACYSGVFDKEFRQEPGDERWKKEPTCPEKVRESLRGNTRFYFTSTGEGDRSASESIFALRFLNRLQERDDDGIVSYYELYAKLLGSVRPKPHQGEFNDHEQGSDFVFIRNAVCTPKGGDGTTPCEERPAIDPANLNSDPTLKQTWQEAKHSELLAVVPRVEGGYAAFGYAEAIAGKHAVSPEEIAGGGGEDMFLLLMDRFNKTERLLTLGRRGDERALAGIQTYDGGYALAGYTDSPGAGASGKKDAYVVKLDAEGQYQWHCRSGSRGDDQFNKIVQLDNGTLVVAGSRDGFPYLAKITPEGQLEPFAGLSLRNGAKGQITGLVHTPYDDVALAGNVENGRNPNTPFLLRFDAERGERVGQVLYFSKAQEGMSVMGLAWNAQNKILLLCTEETDRQLENATLLVCEERDNQFILISSPTFGGTAPDVPSGLCNDVFGYTYLSGGGKSYRAQGGLFDRGFLVEVNPQASNTGAQLGWQGSPKSNFNALVMLPNRRLVVVGKDAPDIAAALHFDLRVRGNEAPDLSFERQNFRFRDGKNDNQHLEAGENGWYMLRVENKCHYVTGAIIQVDVATPNTVKCPRNLYLNDFAAMSGQWVALPLTGLAAIRPGASTSIRLTLLAGGQKVEETIQIRH